MNYRIEKDTMGEVKVPADALYGAQTQRSVENFKIAQDINKMPIPIYPSNSLWFFIQMVLVVIIQ